MGAGSAGLGGERCLLLTTFTRDATTQVVTGERYEQIRARITAKHGFMTRVAKALGAIGGTLGRRRISYGDAGVVVTPGPARS